MPFEDKSQAYLESGYGLGRGYASSLRLNFQHALLRDLLGYTIHPDIHAQKNLRKNAKIADIGTGTGQWLIDVSRELPSAQLDGFDISVDQFPSKSWLPSSVTLQELDITKPLPFNLENSYDLVHVQLFLCVIQKEGPSNILRKGGFIQWVEYDPVSFKVVAEDSSLKQTANNKHVEIIRGPDGKATEWPSHLPHYLTSAGFEATASTSYPLPPDLYAPFMQCHLFAAEEVSLKMMKNDGPEAQGPMFRALLEEVHQECRQGVTMTESPIVVTGRKPV